MFAKDLCREYNLDEYIVPTFAITSGGKRYEANLTTYQALIDLTAKEEELQKKNVPPHSAKWLVEVLTFVFSGSKREMWEKMPLAKLAAVAKGVTDFVAKSLSTSLTDLENFNKGKAESAPAKEA